eukprot:Partr_v1_DN23544_c0_g1_i1_m14235 putative trimethylguanosine synthase
MEKYYGQRHRYFSRFDEGIQIVDDESWFSVTPELIAKHIAEKCGNRKLMVDAFCGVGGNAIQFAMTCDHVIAIDIRPDYISQARNNARIYGVEDKIQFICGSFFDIMPQLVEAGFEIDGIFLSPPWGGPDYINSRVYSLASIEPVDGFKLMQYCNLVTNNIVLYIPRNTSVPELLRLKNSTDESVEIEQNILSGKLKTIAVYFGSFCGSV